MSNYFEGKTARPLERFERCVDYRRTYQKSYFCLLFAYAPVVVREQFVLEETAIF